MSDEVVTPKKLFYPINEYLQLPTEAETWLIEPLIPAGGLVNLYAAAKVGKSFLAIDLALAIAQGRSEWLGFKVNTQGRVLYLQVDTPRSLWAKRYREMSKAGISFEPADQMMLADQETAYEWGCYPFDILDPKHFLALRDAVKQYEPKLIVVDTIREIHRGEENDSGHMQAAIGTLTQACHPSAVMIISHSRKGQSLRNKAGEVLQDASSLMDKNRGSGYVSGRCDTIMELTKGGHLNFQGRAVEETTVHLFRDENTGLWTLDEDTILRNASEAMLNDTKYTKLSLRAKSKALATQMNRKETACYSALQRAAHKRKGLDDV